MGQPVFLQHRRFQIIPNSIQVSNHIQVFSNTRVFNSTLVFSNILVSSSIQVFNNTLAFSNTLDFRQTKVSNNILDYLNQRYHLSLLWCNGSRDLNTTLVSKINSSSSCHLNKAWHLIILAASYRTKQECLNTPGRRCSLTTSSNTLYQAITCLEWEWLELSRLEVWRDHSLSLQFQCLLILSNITLGSHQARLISKIMRFPACSQTALISIRVFLNSNNPLNFIQLPLIR